MAIGSDGLPVREVQAWSEEKLFYVSRYIDIFTTAMKGKWPLRVYIDLFSGPGLSVVERSGNELPGSPLLALRAKYPFTDLYFNDVDAEATEALQTRAAASLRSNLVIRNLDCNEAARDARDRYFSGGDAGGTLGLAFIDPTAFQIGLDAIADLTKGSKIDLIITVMTGFLKRFIGERSYQDPLDRFFGSSDWRGLVDLKASGERLTFRRLLDHYEDKLRELGYIHVDDDIRILNSKESTLYHLVFASKHPRGAEFFKKISQKRFSGQRRLALE